VIYNVISAEIKWRAEIIFFFFNAVFVVEFGSFV
jgi:hypothetical protein